MASGKKRSPFGPPMLPEQGEGLLFEAATDFLELRGEKQRVQILIDHRLRHMLMNEIMK